MLKLSDFLQLICCFLYDQTYPNAWIPSFQVLIDVCPVFVGKISVFYNASVTFCAPSDPSGPLNMCCELIRATPSWWKDHAQYDCVFVNTWPELAGMWGLEVAQIFLFFSFVHKVSYFPCVLVQWFSIIGDEPDDETGLWMVEPNIHQDGQPHLAIIHLDTIYRAAHLIPVLLVGLYQSITHNARHIGRIWCFLCQ